MKIKRILAIAAATLTPTISHAAVTDADFSDETIIETFEDLPTFFLPNPIELDGVTYTAVAFGAVADDQIRSGICGTDCLSSRRGDTVYEIDLGGSFTRVGIEAFGLFGGPATLEAYDAGGGLLGSITGEAAVTTLGDESQPDFLALESDLGAITAIRLIQTGGTVGWGGGVMGIDNLHRDPGAPIPLPGAAAVFLAGLGVLRAVRRR